MTPRPARFRDWLFVVAGSAAVSLAYHDKPFHIDDVLYLRVADQILHTPADPYQGVVLWDAKDGQPASLFLTDHNPPVWKYCQAGTLAAFAKPNERGESERLLHLLQTLAVVVASLGAFQLGRRLCPFPLWATFALMTAPFFLPGVNIMLEAPALCFSLWAIEFQFRAWDSPRPFGWSLLAGVVASTAILTKYTSGLLLPLLFLESLRQRKLRSLWFLLPPILALVGWGAWGIAVHGRPHLGAHGLAFNAGEWHLKALNVVRLVGGVQVFGIVVFLAAWWRGDGRRRLKLFLVAAVGFALTWLDVQQAVRRCAEEFAFMTPLQAVHFWTFDVHGFVSLGLLWALRDSPGIEERTSGWFLWMWMALVLLFNVCCTPFNAVRHLMMFFVPFVWIVGCWLERLDVSSLRWPALAASAALGFALASADHQFAESTREIARTEFRALVADRAAVGRTVWFTANWGLVHYGARAGGLPWIRRPEEFGMPPIQEGDLLVEQKITSWASIERFQMDSRLQKFKHWQPMADVAPTPAAFAGQFLRTIAPNANYYTVTSNTLPWEFLIMAVDPLDRKTGALFTVPTLGDYIVYRVVRNRPEQEAR